MEDFIFVKNKLFTDAKFTNSLLLLFSLKYLLNLYLFIAVVLLLIVLSILLKIRSSFLSFVTKFGSVLLYLNLLIRLPKL